MTELATGKMLIDELTQQATEAGCVSVRHGVAAALTAIDEGAISEAEHIPTFFAKAIVDPKYASLFAQANPEADVAYAELQISAFRDKSPDARAKLMKLDPGAADAAARAWGLDSIRDYRNVAVQPASVRAPAADSKSNNPFLDESEAGPARRAAAFKSLGAVKSASLAHSVGRDIAGRVLRKTLNPA